MKIYNDIDAVEIKENCAVTLGNFDGVHLGHQEIITKTVNLSESECLCNFVITFSPHPVEFFGKPIDMLMTTRKKNKIFEEMGVKNHLIINFTSEIAFMEPEIFVREILIKHLKSKHIVVGYDYKFGRQRKGDHKLLSMLETKYKYVSHKVEKIELDGITVSSTNIRELVRTGNISLANNMLGRFYSLEGYVVRGDGIGRLIGFPTANVEVKNELVPKFGVYASVIIINGSRYNSVTNIGIRPTIANSKGIKIETHIFDFNQDIYDEFVEVELVAYIRGEEKFDDFDSLKNMIKSDCYSSLRILDSI